MATIGMHTAELLDQSKRSLESGQWETARTYARAVLARERESRDFRALALHQAAIIELLSTLYPDSELIRELLETNRTIRNLDAR